MTEMMRGNLPTYDEIIAIRDSILLPMMLSICENKCRDIEFDQQPLRQLYLAANHALMNRINGDLTRVKKLLRASKIKVVEDDKVADATIYYRYFCRGYNDIFALTRDVVKAEISVRLGQYIGDLVQSVWEGEQGVAGHGAQGYHDPI
ncbi:hypothetical protein [Paenibacillus sp. MBLB4367]|uniref:hypothetical protein n=1 Tax=Paenibacillus sp. MBLB4367 TaxID=3384767 RepID=UPI0039082964